MAEIRKGRRKGSPKTRQEILESARTLFAARGFTGTSIRGIAADAKVDPALVHHYFGTKEGLFRSLLDIPIDPEALVSGLTAAGPEEVPRQIVETFLDVWESEETGPVMVGFLRRAMADPGSAALLRDFAGAAVLRTAAEKLLGHMDPESAQTRIALVASHMIGLVILRNVLRIGPLVALSHAQITAAVAPAIDRYLYGDGDELDLHAAIAQSATAAESRNP